MHIIKIIKIPFYKIISKTLQRAHFHPPHNSFQLLLAALPIVLPHACGISYNDAILE
jgi:hypothetical protein